MVLLCALPGIALVTAFAKRSYDRERASAGRHLVSTTRAVAVLVERKFESAEALLRGLAALPSLEEGDLGGFEQRVRATPLREDEWIVLLRTDNQQLVNTRLPPGSRLPATRMPDDFWAAMRRGEAQVSNVFVGTVVGTPVLTVGIPIRQRGELKYGLFLAMLPESLARAVAPQQITSSDLLGVIDRDGVLAVRSRSPELFVGKKASPALVTAARERAEGIIESTTADGISTLTAFSRSATIGWTAAIGVPLEELHAPARRFVMFAAIGTAIITLVAALTAMWIARTVVGGMDALIADTEKMGAGELPDHRGTGLDEVEVVAAALQNTAAKLQARERELRQINTTLEDHVAARTRELRTANRDLEEFARVAAHDLRQPLRSMISFAELLREEAKLDAVGREYLERIWAAAHRLRRMLEGILAYSTAAAPGTLTVENVDLNEIVIGVRNDLADRLAQTKGSIELGPLGVVNGDANQIHQLLLNLIGNALKFHRPDVPPVVRVESVDDGRWLHVTVSDNGRGFDPAAVEIIFLPFERLQRDIEGSGIGLAIVRRIAERHGGSVTAHSTPGEGSVFRVSLPAGTRPA